MGINFANSSGYFIRKLRDKDVPRISELGKSCPEFLRFWDYNTIQRFVDDGLSRGVYSYHPSDHLSFNIVGFVLATYQQITRKVTWENAFLDKEYRGKGIMAKAYSEVWEEAKSRGAKIAECLVDKNNKSPDRMLMDLNFSCIGHCRWFVHFEDEH